MAVIILVCMLAFVSLGDSPFPQEWQSYGNLVRMVESQQVVVKRIQVFLDSHQLETSGYEH